MTPSFLAYSLECATTDGPSRRGVHGVLSSARFFDDEMAASGGRHLGMLLFDARIYLCGGCKYVFYFTLRWLQVRVIERVAWFLIAASICLL